MDPPFSLGVVCAPFGLTGGFFTSFGFAFSGETFGGVAVVGLLSATPSDEPGDFLPLCFFLGGRFTESPRSRVSMSFSRLT